MKANELRIGNLVLYKGELFEIDFDSFNIIKELEPIELTEEILLKCGFFYDSDADTFKISNCTMQLDSYGFDGYMVIIFGEDLRLIKHLHQLQNLYFALTGEELQINL